MEKIRDLKAREILDSRGDPTVEVELQTENHIRSIASAPSGASVGAFEAVELRDNDPNRFGGKGVLKALKGINETIKPALLGQDVQNQESIDQLMIELDGTPHKSNLGSNAILAVSEAVCKAAAASTREHLYRYIQKLTSSTGPKLPRPMFNFIEGGKHADNNLEVQEFLVVPNESKFSDNLRYASEKFGMLKKILKNLGIGLSVGHEGGFAPNLSNEEDALKLLQKLDGIHLAVDFAGAVPKALPLDTLATNYPVISFEDPAAEDDWGVWKQITQKFGAKMMIVGDDLYSSSAERLKKGVAEKTSNAVIIKPNQIGTISEVLAFVKLARESGQKLIVSHRSGETEDTFIADFAVGVAAEFAKFGAPSRGERISKYNRLLRIEEEIGQDGQ